MQTASQLKSVHLLRALLREASYLPDDYARAYFRRYIVNRFRAYQPVQNASKSRDAQAIERYTHRSAKRRHEGIIKERARAMQRKGQKGLNYLRRATLGEAPCLEKILLLTYGRLGKRRYALLEGLLRPDDHEDAAKPAPLQKLYHSNKRFLSFFDAPREKSDGGGKKTEAATHHRMEISDRFSRLKAVLKMQNAAGITMSRRLKRPFLQTPIHNVWLRPMPVNRARNNARKWYATAMGDLLPPLPNEEWEAINAMIDGKKHISFAKRRTPVVTHDPEPVPEDAFTAFVHDALALDKPSRADRPSGIQRPHNLTPRFMKRLYGKMFIYCCKLDWNEEQNKWQVTWGRGLNRMNSATYVAPVASSLFDGVDERGQIVREKGKRRESAEPEEPGEPDEPEESQEPGRKGKKKYQVVPFYVSFLPRDHPMRVETDKWRSERGEQEKARGGVSRFEEAAAARSGGESV
ncbi:hypothetical protein P280DRAFT_470169 [Massarina eburnea CBS 473.64]|uniref:LYR motif-containing protein Cup1-like N-terminal domain-containing protein n=1 Tax=Massarina eburnea CBS 473.64 TaxID=1395130 RepID=A0A6A6RZ79_9PLEO|nr:hypothetical protein P280DRAFT_470169 [Massarina eburnea CBS 473.64]